MKKIIALVLAVAMAFAIVACGGTPTSGSSAPSPSASASAAVSATQSAAPSPSASQAKPMKTGTILYLSNISSGPGYDSVVSYLNMVCKQLGYKVSIIYGDPMNDPAGNLKAVKNAMTNDVVGLIASQDGGIAEIMKEYPNLFVVGYNSDMASVYSDGGASAAAKTNTKFLGSICDGYVSGVDTGHQYSKAVIDKGFKTVSTIVFPDFAFPQLAIAEKTFRADIDTFNQTAAADKKITIVGDTTVLMFQPLDASYFMEPTHQNLDCVVGFCAGIAFVYPTLKSAVAAGTISKNTKLITGGFENDKDTLADFGGNGIIQMLSFSPSEDIIYALVLLDNAIQGNQFKDYSASERINGARYQITTKQQMDNVVNKSMAANADISKTVAPWDTVKSLFVRNNPDATYKALKDFINSDRLTVDFLGK